MFRFNYFQQFLILIVCGGIALFLYNKQHKINHEIVDNFELYYNHPLRDIKYLLKYFKKNKHPHSTNKNIAKKTSLDKEMKYIRTPLLNPNDEVS